MFKRACIAFGLLQFSQKPLDWLMWRCATAVAVSDAHYRPISSLQPSCSFPLSHRHHHLATVSVAVERTGILGLAPLSRSPLLPCLIGSHQRDHLLDITLRCSLLRHSSKGFRVGHSSVSSPAWLAGCRLNFRTACPALPPVWWVVWQAAGCAIVHRKCVSAP